jgi:hypothetical protein
MHLMAWNMGPDGFAEPRPRVYNSHMIERRKEDDT